MCLTTCTFYSKLPLKEISSQHSNAAARKIINENFRLVGNILDCLKCINITDINGITFPQPLVVGTEYNWLYTGNNQFTLVPDLTTGSSSGTKYIINPNDNIFVGHDYQYIVHEYIYIDGVIDIEGELVVL